MPSRDPHKVLAEVPGTLFQLRKPLSFSGHVLGGTCFRSPPESTPFLILQIFLWVFSSYLVPQRYWLPATCSDLPVRKAEAARKMNSEGTGSTRSGSFCENTNFPCFGPDRESFKLFCPCNLTFDFSFYVEPEILSSVNFTVTIDFKIFLSSVSSRFLGSSFHNHLFST